MYKSKYFVYEKPKGETINDKLSKDVKVAVTAWEGEGLQKWRKPLTKVPVGLTIRYVTKLKDKLYARKGGCVTINNTKKKFLMLTNFKLNRGWSVQYKNINSSNSVVGIYYDPEKEVKRLEKSFVKVDKEVSFKKELVKPLTTEEKEALLNDYYYKQGFFVGRDLLFRTIKEEEPSSNITRSFVDKWLKKQVLYQLTKPSKRTRDIARFISKNPYRIVQCDYLSKPDYTIFTCIDLFSRYAFARLMKSSPNTKHSIQGMKYVIDQFKKMSKEDRPVHLVQCDNGSEFKGQFKEFLDKEDIKVLYGIASNSNSQAVVENYNGRLLRLLNRYKIAENERGMSQEIIDKEVDVINRSYNRTIGFSPIDALIKENQPTVLKNLEKNQKIDFEETDDIKINDKVRLKIIDKRKIGRKDINWTEEVFTVAKIVRPRKHPNNPIKYKVEDKTGKLLRGYLQRNDIQVVTGQQNKDKINIDYDIEKLVGRDVLDNRIYYMVKWKGRNQSENSLVLRSKLLEQDPDTVKVFLQSKYNTGIVEKFVGKRKRGTALYWDVKWKGRDSSENRVDVLSTDLQRLPYAKRDFGMGNNEKEIKKAL